MNETERTKEITEEAPVLSGESSVSGKTEVRSLTCIGCPMGCALTVKLCGGSIAEISGYTCKRGKTYAEKEVTAPARTVTSTIRVKGGELPVVSVKTITDIPKEKIFDCVRALKDAEVTAPVCIGDVILKDVCGTGVDVVSTKNIRRVS